jgi:hypothetical protein
MLFVGNQTQDLSLKGRAVRRGGTGKAFPRTEYDAGTASDAAMRLSGGSMNALKRKR